ncbi:NAD(P)-binding protein [Mesorhizobium sp. B3-2-1]|uniref:NAD(P)-binding protein n=1 Tax=Mesorhizobium sp. B3-2-1 TaxID=2589891 RepID=UPI001FEEB60E|nr:NAD(P)-binding protein [Mesorhizobium sp. B3-2-1]
MADILSADFIVVGSGIIGSLVAHKLALAGASVIILEAGPRVTRGELVARFRNSTRRSDWMSPYPPASWAPHPVYQPEPNNHLIQAGPYPYAAEYIRQVGGTTWHWAAHAWRNVRNDFRIKSLYGVGVDWPMSYDDLEPFYQEAEEIMGVSGAPNTGSPRNKPFPMESVAEPYAMRRLPRFSAVPDSLEVHVVGNPGSPYLGVAEAAQGPTAGAIANAFRHATGKRIHDLPYTRERVKAVLGV